MNGCRTWADGHRWERSGWCAHGCGKRNDGRIVINGDEKYPGPDYTPEQLHRFLTEETA